MAFERAAPRPRRRHSVQLLSGDIRALPPGQALDTLHPVAPVFEAGAILSIGVPHFLVTLVSQNRPGLVVLRSADFEPAHAPCSPTADLRDNCGAVWRARYQSGRKYHGHLHRRGGASPTGGPLDRRHVLYRFLPVPRAVGAGARSTFLALPPAIIAALTGVALIPAVLGAMEPMFANRAGRDPANVTFRATGSGLTLFGLAAAFWGLALGFAALAAETWLNRRRASIRYITRRGGARASGRRGLAHREGIERV